MAGLPPIVGIELGTSKVRVLVGESREDGHLMITGVGEESSRGIRKGELIHFDNALACVKSALDQAEEQSDVTINEVNIVLSGGHIRGTVNRGSVPVMSHDREITPEDIEHVTATAKAVSLPPDREVIHTIHQHFYVDDHPGVIDPAGMEGSKLSLDMLIVHGVRSHFRNIARVVKTSQVQIRAAALGGLCSALAVLTPEQKESGVMVIDLGGGTTDYLLYSGKTLSLAGTLGVGGDHITNDLSIGLRIPTAQAERLKIEFGSAMIDLSSRSKSVSIPPEGGFSGGSVRLKDVHTICHSRMDEIFTLIRNELHQSNLLKLMGAGIVLTGGGAKIGGATELASRVFDQPCWIGKPRNVSGLATVTDGSEYAVPVGLLRFAERNERRDTNNPGLFNWMKTILGK